eukprot:m51a1_g14714 hypothetical protein (586) ;mRNA; r:165709-169102
MFAKEASAKVAFELRILSAANLPPCGLYSVSWQRGSKPHNRGETPALPQTGTRVVWDQSVRFVNRLFCDSPRSACPLLDPKCLTLELRVYDERRKRSVTASTVRINMSAIDQVKNVLHLFLRSLPKRALFNIVGFGSSFVKLFEDSQPYTEQTFEVALKHVSCIAASMGGTYILEPLQSIVGSARPNATQQVFLLTDGKVKNPLDVVAYAREHSRTTRIFSFGIGRSADVGLVEGIAEATGGRSEFIRSGERIEAKVMAQFHVALEPVLRDCKVSLESGGCAVSALKASHGHSGDHLTFLVTMSSGQATVQGRITAAVGPSDYVEFPFELCLAAATAAPSFVHRLCCYSQIRELEGESGTADNSSAITALAMQGSLLSPYTSFVAVERRDVALGSSATVVELSHALREPARPQHPQQRASRVADVVLHRDIAACSVRVVQDVVSDECCCDALAEEEEPDCFASTGPESPRASCVAEGAEACAGTDGGARAMDVLARLQRFDGSWRDLDQVCAAVGIDCQCVRALPPMPDGVWATAIAVVALEVRWEANRVEWVALVDKARGWIASQVGAGDLGCVYSSARGLIGA